MEFAPGGQATRETETSAPLNVLVVGAGVYACGIGTEGSRTILPALYKAHGVGRDSSTRSPSPPRTPTKRGRYGLRVQGVWIRSRWPTCRIHQLGHACRHQHPGLSANTGVAISVTEDLNLPRPTLAPARGMCGGTHHQDRQSCRSPSIAAPTAGATSSVGALPAEPPGSRRNRSAGRRPPCSPTPPIRPAWTLDR